jgi:hypothetical protein
MMTPGFNSTSPIADRVSNWFRNSVPMLTSLCVHTAILLILGAVIFPGEIAGISYSLIFSNDESDAQNEPALFETAPSAEAASGDLAETSDVAEIVTTDLELVPDVEISSLASEMVADAVNVDAVKINELNSNVATKPLATASIRKGSSATMKELLPPKSKYADKNTGKLLTDPKEGIKEASDVKGATEGVFDRLHESASSTGEGEELWVVWLMDASISLEKDRKDLAPLVQQFYAGLGWDKSRKSNFYSAVCAFGSMCVPIYSDRGFPEPDKLKSAIMSVPTDESGIENVCNSLLSVLQTIPFRRNQKIEIVIWTDEAGDDHQYLEDAIFVSRQRNARVHIVGPLSVLGMRKGLQEVALPQPWDISVVLPVDRGPDSFFPERVRLPIWDSNSSTRWGAESIVLARDAVGGGPHRQYLLAATGPYALARLSLATGGTFTTLVRKGETPSVLGEKLQDYLPDYRSAMEIAYDIDKYPLRRAVIAAAAITNSVEIWPREVSFPFQILDRFPYTKTRLYYVPPAEFQSNIEKVIPIEYKQAFADGSVVESALQVLVLNHQFTLENMTELIEKSKSEYKPEPLQYSDPSAYKKEESLRWKAWYDLNLGRLLAHSVRLQEYVIACEKVMSSPFREEMLLRGINKLTFTPSSNLQGGTEHQYRAKLAMDLLTRVENQHPNTPWARLAALEKASFMGFEIVPGIVPPPVPVVGRVILPPILPRPPLPKL